MVLAKVIGNAVSTEKHRDYVGHKIMVVQPINADGRPQGKSFLAVDGVQAGVGDIVLIVDEGGSARMAAGAPDSTTIRTAICAIVDQVDVDEAERDSIWAGLPPDTRDSTDGNKRGGA